MARRFIIEKVLTDNEIFNIEGKEANHIFVLRNKKGDSIQVNDKICEIIEITKKEICCKVIKDAEVKGIPQVNVTLFQALLKSDKMEYVVQKAVELGAKEIVPFISENVIVKLDEKDMLKKTERWNKISVEASKQCGRSDEVNVKNICGFKDIIERLNRFDVAIIAYEKEKEGLKEAIKGSLDKKNIAIIIGAEGGFEKREVDELLKLSNIKSVSLGERILRAETASVNLLSILMYEFEG